MLVHKKSTDFGTEPRWQRDALTHIHTRLDSRDRQAPHVSTTHVLILEVQLHVRDHVPLAWRAYDGCVGPIRQCA